MEKRQELFDRFYWLRSDRLNIVYKNAYKQDLLEMKKFYSFTLTKRDFDYANIVLIKDTDHCHDTYIKYFKDGELVDEYQFEHLYDDNGFYDCLLAYCYKSFPKTDKEKKENIKYNTYGIVPEKLLNSFTERFKETKYYNEKIILP